VGWGALIGLGVLIAIAAIALWLGPPRDPKCFALDDEDFGLGFKVGDPWDPDAFEAAMKERGINAEPDLESKKEFAEFMEKAQVESFPHVFSRWKVVDSHLQILVSTQVTKSKPVVSAISIDAALPPSDSKNAVDIRLKNEAKALCGDREELFDYYLRMVCAKEMAKSAPQVQSGKGIGIGSRGEEVLAAYGQPAVTIRFQPNDDSPRYWYFGKWKITYFTIWEGRVVTILARQPYDPGNPVNRLKFWQEYFSSLKAKKDIEKEIVNAIAQAEAAP